MTDYSINEGQIVAPNGLGKQVGISTEKLIALSSKKAMKSPIQEPEMLSINEIEKNDTPDGIKLDNPVSAFIPPEMGSFINTNNDNNTQPEITMPEMEPVVEEKKEEIVLPQMEAVIATEPELSSLDQNTISSNTISNNEEKPLNDDVNDFINKFDIGSFYDDKNTQETKTNNANETIQNTPSLENTTIMQTPIAETQPIETISQQIEPVSQPIESTQQPVVENAVNQTIESKPKYNWEEIKNKLLETATPIMQQAVNQIVETWIGQMKNTLGNEQSISNEVQNITEDNVKSNPTIDEIMKSTEAMLENNMDSIGKTL